ncbi:MAG: hypothetical protein Salg2KO_03590 [Salibacteraceae bacterium]
MALQRIKNFFLRNEAKNLYTFPTIDISDIGEWSDLLKQIHIRKLDGVIVTNVFSQEEVRIMNEGILDIPNEQRTPILGGDAFPRIFAQVVTQSFENDDSRQAYLKRYFEQGTDINNGYRALIGVDIKARLENLFKQISGGRAIKIPIGQNNQGEYANATVRRYFPEKGFISVHSGNYFQVEFERFYAHLKEQVNVMNQLSYFVTVNKAERGGELTLFDLEWDEAQGKKDRLEDRFVDRLDGTKADVQRKGSVKRQYINPPEGSVLMFAGGEIWHRIEPVKGKKTRITIGGFMGFSHDDKDVFYWS